MESYRKIEPPADKPSEQLQKMAERDQEVRQKMKEWFEEHDVTQGVTGFGDEMSKIDKQNIAQLRMLIQRNGWSFLFGTSQNFISSWIIAQHADKEVSFQEEYLQRAKTYLDVHKLGFTPESVHKIMSNLAMLDDRILVNKGLPQIYGTQHWTNPKTGTWELRPISREVDDHVISLHKIDTEYVDKKNNINIMPDYLDILLPEDLTLLNKRRNGKHLPLL